MTTRNNTNAPVQLTERAQLLFLSMRWGMIALIVTLIVLTFEVAWELRLFTALGQGVNAVYGMGATFLIGVIVSRLATK